uniref:Uncharacterized protein n=1 Tax=Asterionellopsis glacialis TaxID=33640 RepID=A0A7S0KX52_9STRA|mmetsp:Transcript_1409/g.1960  ORF Transcript_1409/g.1960 Transcript_1409/m.1960 type:complete len:158 (+) Transcript_1409:151-624(+)
MGQACSSGCSDGETSNNNYDIFEEIADGGVQKTVAFDKKISDEMDSMLDAPLTSFDTEETDTNLSDLDNDISFPVAAGDDIAPEKSAAIVATTSSTTQEKKETTTTTTTKAKSQKRKTKKNSSKKKKSGKQGRRGNKHKSKKQNAAGRKTYSEALLG